jgi:superfamily I DNA/RNA helicase
MTVVFDAPVHKFDFVFVDEAQDVSDIQRALLKAAMKKKGRLVAVGDPHQAIYGFRGADSEALNNIAIQFDAKRLPLSISYRCPKAVVAEAQKFVAHIQSHESAPMGDVRRFGNYNHDMFKADDLVVCRCTAPVVKLAYHLLANKVPCTILGRDMGKGIITLIEKRLKATSIDDLRTKLVDWRSKEVDRIRKDDLDADISKIEDKYELIVTFIECSGADTIPQLTRAIDDLFNSDRGGVTLATVHKSKGLEANRVFILDDFLMPLKHAKLPWQLQQERNLQYVSVTRSKSSLFYVNTPRDGFQRAPQQQTQRTTS